MSGATMEIRGNAARDAESFTTAAGMEMTRVMVAWERMRGGKKEVNYTPLLVFGAAKRAAASGVKKGDYVVARGAFSGAWANEKGYAEYNVVVSDGDASSFLSRKAKRGRVPANDPVEEETAPAA